LLRDLTEIMVVANYLFIYTKLHQLMKVITVLNVSHGRDQRKRFYPFLVD